MSNDSSFHTTRREFLAALGGAAAASAAPAISVAAPQSSAPSPTEWICTTQQTPWQTLSGVEVTTADPWPFNRDLEVRLDQPQQIIDGFGGSFSERGWDALQLLPEKSRAEILDAFFTPAGANFSICRTPIGANDIARAWYSYDETDGDFALDRFSVANDQQTLIPFIRSALARRSDLKLWASPWSPPTWMKTNRHYAMTPAWPRQPSNGLQPQQVGREGQDYFIQEDRYFDAYARYFRRYVEEYARAGITISMVMPQNEFNSPQPFPSCCWTPQGLARFIPHLGREMGKVGVQIFLGTLERANADLVTQVLNDPQAGPLIKGLGVQWAGKGALPFIHARHPDLKIWQSEQECGTSANDWHYARYVWDLMKQYFLNGTSAWQYWNMVMPTGGLTGWGWPQNSLVTVDPDTRQHRFNHEFFLLKHASHFVQPGAHRLNTQSFTGFENQLAFRNPDGTVIVLLQNDMAQTLRVRMKIGNRQVTMQLPADSFNTLRLR